MYYLTLGPKVFEAMIFSYEHSMQRKRPNEQSHFKFNFLGDFSLSLDPNDFLKNAFIKIEESHFERKGIFVY